MTDEQARALGERAMACKGWRWMPRMLVHCRDGHILSIVQTNGRASFVGCTATGSAHGWRRKGWPDLRDPATVGCLLALVREAWVGHTHSHAVAPVRTVWAECNSLSGEWSVVDDECIELGCGSSEAEALVAALEAAP